MSKQTINIKPFKVQVTPEQSREMAGMLEEYSTAYEEYNPEHRYLFVYERGMVVSNEEPNTEFITDAYFDLLHPHEAIARIKEAIAAAKVTSTEKKQMEAKHAAVHKAEEALKSLRAEARKILNACNTIKQLKEAWPEVEQFIPEENKEQVGNALMLRPDVAKLNKMLGIKPAKK